MAISKGMIEFGIGMVLFVYVMAATLPGAITSIGCGTYQGPGLAAVASLWALIPIFIVIAAILLVYKYVK